MKHWVKLITTLVFLSTWIAGMVIAKGFWSTFFCIILFPWSWYLLIERILQAFNLV